MPEEWWPSFEYAFNRFVQSVKVTSQLWIFHHLLFLESEAESALSWGIIFFFLFLSHNLLFPYMAERLIKRHLIA